MSTMLPPMPPTYATAGTPTDSAESAGRGRLFALIFGAVAAAVTIGAILLAVIAPAFSSAPPSPGNWTKVFDGDLSSASSAVSTGQGCQLGSDGLDVVGGQNVHTACAISFSGTDPLANGFLMTVTLAPNGHITSGGEQPYIVLGDSGVVAVEQPSTDSKIVICTPDCSDSSNPVTLGSDAWHNDAFYANTLTLYWPGSGQQLAVYANGQEVTAVNFSYTAGSNGLALGAISQGEALYTHLALYTR